MERFTQFQPSLGGFALRHRCFALISPRRYEETLQAISRALASGVNDRRLIDLAKRLRPRMRAADKARARGVALYRAGKWKDAISMFERSIKWRGGAVAHDWVYMAMALQQLGHKEKARGWYDKAVVRMDKNKPADERLERLRVEAEEVLGIKN